MEAPAAGEWAESWAEVEQTSHRPAHCSEGEVRCFVTAFVIVDLRTGSSSFEGNSTSCYEIGYTNGK